MPRRCLQMTIALIALLSCVALAADPNAPIRIEQCQGTIRVACVGDSITAGVGAAKRESYPDQLGKMLGQRWQVRNFGVSGSTLLNHGDKPYQKQKAFQAALQYQPQAVVIMLGTNDTKPQNWKLKGEFAADYKDLLGQFAKLPSKPRVFICRPVPVPGQGNYGINEAGVLEQAPMIDKIAQEMQTGVIDMHSALNDHPEMLPDRVHPNTAGATLMAKAAFKALTGKEFPASVPALLTSPAVAADSEAEQGVQQVEVFQGGSEGYHTYRIPAIVLSNKNTLLAFCEGRKTGADDAGDIDLVLRRSTDGGKTWRPIQVVYEKGVPAKTTIGNPCPVVERTTGTIWLPFCRNNDRVFITKSTDDGLTWDKPAEITRQVKMPEWRWYATGPGHGIQLQSGRLVIPCDCRDSRDKKQHSLVFYSDDHGQAWKLGGVTEADMDECEVVELVDKSLLLSLRNYRGKNRRAFAASSDGGRTWSKPTHHEQVYCPTCQASILRYPPLTGGRNRILYSGPGGPGRKNMTVRLSYDEGKTWPVAKVLCAGSAAYSDLVVLPDGSIGCLYERDGYRKITFARFSLGWLTARVQQPRGAGR